MLRKVTFLLLVSAAIAASSGGMDCLKNKDCASKNEHLCNMQSGLWTKNFMITVRNGSGAEENLDSCACCFMPETFKYKAGQRALLDSATSGEPLDSRSSQEQFVSTFVHKACSLLRKPCLRTSDCCSGYCSSTEGEGFCYDPLVLSDSEKFPDFGTGRASKQRLPRHGTRQPGFASLEDLESSSNQSPVMKDRMTSDDEKKN